MDLNLPLALLALSSALVIGGRAILVRPRAWSWLAVAIAILAAAGVSYLLAPRLAGFAAFGVWALFVLGPMLLSRVQATALLRQRYGTASIASRALVLLHPSRGHRAAAARARAYVAAAHGDVERAKRELDRYARFGRMNAAEAELEKVRLGTDEAAIREVLASTLDLPFPTLAHGRVRALAEIGERDEAFRRFREAERAFEGDAAISLRTAAYLLLFAEAGRVRDVESIFAARLRGASKDLQELWIACARFAAGDPAGEKRLRALMSSPDGLVRRAAQIRLSTTRQTGPLSPEDAQLCDRFAARLAEEDRFRFGSTAAKRPVITHAIALLILAVLGLEELSGGATDTDTLQRLGALSAAAVLEGREYWRLVAPLWLHYGVAHAVFNLLGLYVLGPFVERALGRERFTIVYLLSGLFGTTLFVVRSALFPGHDEVLVGASGCIMGLLGASVAILYRGAFHERSLSARRRLGLMGFVLVAQTAFDLLIPEISAFAHVVGALTGLVFGLWLTAGGARTESPSRLPRTAR
ncbi:MAG: rhomboid family intramembrane serine protease [Polyangiaceae bacterium]|nr:rhomboid family intramembrane serine protease [Polyangiaceae bacterium]